MEKRKAEKKKNLEEKKRQLRGGGRLGRVWTDFVPEEGTLISYQSSVLNP